LKSRRRSLVVAEVVNPVCRRGVALRAACRAADLVDERRRSCSCGWRCWRVVAFPVRHMRHDGAVATAGKAVGLSRPGRDCAALAFLILILHPGYEYASKRVLSTPALQISNTWRAAALPVGTGLMALFGCCGWFATATAAGRGAAITVAVVIGLFC